MRRTQIHFVILATVLLLGSCASGPQPIPLTLSRGEARLTDIQMPEYVREDLPYDVIISIESEGTPQLKRVCFRWVTAEISTFAPSLYCYAMGGTFGLGSPCAPWTANPGPNSSPFCVDASGIDRDIPGRLKVRIVPVDLRTCYNMLEGQVEYVSQNGTVCLTNTVRTSVIIEK